MLLHPPSQSLLLRAPDPLMIRAHVPDSRLLFRDDFNIAVHHTLEASRVLRNIGVASPAPIRWDYRWPGKFTPFEHQIQMAEFQTLYRRAFNLSEPGTSKTAPALWATDWLMKTGRVKKTLICAPLSTLERVWLDNIFGLLLHRKGVLVQRREGARNLSLDVDFYVMNHDGVKISDILEMVRKNPDINQLIIDEGDEFRNSDTEKFKALTKMVREDMRIWWMTGTPCPNDPTDAWAQAKIVNPSNVPKYFGAFKRMTMFKVTEFKWVARPEGYEMAYKALQPAIRFAKKDCLDLPPVIAVDRQAELTKEQRKAFNDMKNQMKLEDKRVQITAVNAADRITKLRQILCGVVKNPVDDTYLEIPHGPRVELLLEEISRAKTKTYVIVPFKGIIHSLAREVAKHYSVDVLNGDISQSKRPSIVKRFMEDEDPKVLLCHPKVMSHGLDFTVADTLIAYGPIYSNSQWQQGIERFNRPGQKHKMRLVRMAAHPLEWSIYQMVDTKRESQDNILKLYKSVMGS